MPGWGFDLNYYPFHLGDYAAHTAHLEPMEDLAYRRMLDLYYRTERPLPREIEQIARLIRMKGYEEAISQVAGEFFEECPDGWMHVRCDAEIAKMQDKQAKAKASAQASVNARSTNAQRTLNERSTDVELPTPTPTPTPIAKEEGEKPRKRDPAPTKPDDVDAQTWADWLALRKAKRAPVTVTVVNGARAESDKAGMTLDAFLQVWCRRGSQGLEAGWLKPDERVTQSRVVPISFAQQDEQARRRRWEEMTGRKWPESGEVGDF